MEPLLSQNRFKEYDSSEIKENHKKEK